MPLYEYCCESCGEQFDAFRAVSECQNPAVCPTCGDEAPRVMSLPRTRILKNATRIGMERNEKSKHEPMKYSGKSPKDKAKSNPDAPPKLKSGGKARPWMLGHA